ncbi:MAG: hypothetical protein QME14_06400 [Methanobacteriaceae archaeon]|nr:hypothetical protein [Methanobacteriaceae archaeon]
MKNYLKKLMISNLLILIIVFSISSAFAADIIATQKGPSKAVKGENITIEYVITNNGNQAIYQVSVSDQNFYKYIGIIKKGETKRFTEKVYIPTDNEVKQDFGPDATVSNPFFIGAVGVSYQDSDGNQYTINSNSLNIPLTEKNQNQNPGKVNNVTPETKEEKGILQEIVDFLNSIIRYFKDLLNIQ